MMTNFIQIPIPFSNNVILAKFHVIPLNGFADVVGCSEGTV